MKMLIFRSGIGIWLFALASCGPNPLDVRQVHLELPLSSFGSQDILALSVLDGVHHSCASLQNETTTPQEGDTGVLVFRRASASELNNGGSVIFEIDEIEPGENRIFEARALREESVLGVDCAENIEIRAGTTVHITLNLQP